VPSTDKRPAASLSPCAAALACALVLASAGCGKKGPPLPPLVKLPAAPGDLSAERHGDDVTVRFTVPAANTDNTKPANVERVDVYAFTGPTSTSDDDVLKRGTKVGTVAVKAPRDPNATVDEDESTDEVEAPQGRGLDQGAVAHVDERLTPAARVPANLQARARRGKPSEGPLVGPSTLVSTRVYVGVGVSTRGRHGPFSRRVAVPLVDPPAPPSAPSIAYDESAITVTWTGGEAPGADEPLPSYPLGVGVPSFAYNVYEVTPPGPPGAAQAATPPAEARLTTSPITASTYSDTRMDWGKDRCYAIRAIESFGDLKIESRESAPACKTLVDTFPPAAPRGLQAVPSQGSISLIWDPNGEKDLAGYVVLRGLPGLELTPLTPTPIAETNFKDTVPSGVRYTYAIVAVDKSGNKSARSQSVDETARD